MNNENRVMSAKAFSTGDNMLRLMKDSRIGIVDLARVSGIYEGVILEILADVCEVDIDTLCRLADALGALVDSVLEQSIKDNGFYEKEGAHCEVFICYGNKLFHQKNMIKT